MRGSFMPKIAHRVVSIPTNVILIDDVLTTGATLVSAAIVLKEMGVQRVFGLTLGRVP